MRRIKTWDEHLAEPLLECKKPTKELEDQYKSEFWKLPSEVFALFHLEQIPCDKELINDSAKHIWGDLRDACNEFKVATDIRDIEMAIVSAYRMGVSVGKLEKHHDPDMLIAASQARLAQLKSTESLRAKEDGQKLLKEMTQLIAQAEWKKDKEGKIRIGEMTEIVWPILIDAVNDLDAEKYLSDRGAQGLRSWVREVAPAYATKRGRPAKNKKQKS